MRARSAAFEGRGAHASWTIVGDPAQSSWPDLDESQRALTDLVGHALNPVLKLGRQIAHPRLLTIGATHRIGAAVDLYRHRRHQFASCSVWACCCASTSRTASAARARAWAVS